MTVHVSIPIEGAAKADLDARARGLPLATMLLDAVETYVREDRSVADAVARGRAATAAGDLHDHKDVVAEFAVRRAIWQLRV